MPEDWPSDKEEQLEMLLSSVNSETKSVVLAFCLDNEYRSVEELSRRFSEIVVSPFSWTAHTLEGYAEQTFVKVGLVAKDEFFPEGNPEAPEVRYALTDAGLRFGRELAAFNIEFAVHNDMSVYSIFGSTQSSGDSRSPYNTFKIIEALQKNKDVRLVDIKEDIVNGWNTVLNTHLTRLAKAGIISYDSVSPDAQGWAKYFWNDGKNPAEVQKVRTYKTLTRLVAEELSKCSEGADYHFIAERLGISPVAQRNVGHILAELEKQGFVHSYINGNKKSKARLTEKGEKVHKEYVLPVRQFIETSDGVVRDSFELFSSDVNLRREYAEKAVQLYKIVSPYLNRKSVEYHFDRIIACLRIKEKNTKELAKELAMKSALIRHYLSLLFSSGAITKRKAKHEVFYSLKKK